MRTTIRIDEKLLERAKNEAIRQKKSLTAVIEDALRESLARQREAGQRETVRLVTCGGKGLLPGVDLDDSAALLELMESGHDPD
ncbi:MAG TPA: DUF6364 family protein [Anaerolineales bacterium]|nr:DUF6364 family protein [Anaerolineales bacterium]